MDVSNIVLQAHKGIGYLTLLAVLLFIIALLQVMFSYSGKISNFLRKSTTITMAIAHTQVLVGLILLFFFSKGFEVAKASGMLMKDSYMRKTYIEHPVSMLIAAIIFTIINSYNKKHSHIAMKIVILAVLALLFIGYAFPWDKVF